MTHFEDLRHTLAQLSRAERRDLFAWLDRSNELLYGPDRIEDAKATYGPAAPVPEYMTRDEFLEFQEQSAIPYEYVNGIIRQISGPSIAHCRLTQNLFDAVRTRLRGSPCEAFCAGLQLNLTLGAAAHVTDRREDEIVYKPDLFVVCDTRGWGKNWVPNPKLVVEVLSPSTQYIDRREKLVNYSRTPSLEEYVIVAQNRVEIAVHRRAQNWVGELVSGPRGVAELRSLGLAVPMAEIYEHAFDL
jgi:Uma2 family endonuclease